MKSFCIRYVVSFIAIAMAIFWIVFQLRNPEDPSTAGVQGELFDRAIVVYPERPGEYCTIIWLSEQFSESDLEWLRKFDRIETIDLTSADGLDINLQLVQGLPRVNRIVHLHSRPLRDDVEHIEKIYPHVELVTAWSPNKRTEGRSSLIDRRR